MAQEKCTPLRFSARPPPLSLSCLRRLPYRAHFVRTPAPLPTTGTKPSGVSRRVPTHQRVLQTIGYLSEHLPLRRLWWLFSVDIPEPLSLSFYSMVIIQKPCNRGVCKTCTSCLYHTLVSKQHVENQQQGTNFKTKSQCAHVGRTAFEHESSISLCTHD